jgi:rhamnogalacturonan endolyase
MVMPGTAYETSSGGPFMRDINMQQDAQHELYWYMNSGHIRTEPWRFGLHGPYALVFNNGTKPSEDLDTSFFDQLNIDGYVPLSGRGYVSGTTTGIPSEFETVLHWSNPQAQYWAKAVNGQYTSPAMKPGTYTVKLYRNEYLLETQSVVVSAGETVVKNHDYQPPQRNVIWKIGEFDGQPFEFKNGNKFLRMHPSDTRMSPWGGVYTVGTHNATDFPMAIFKDAAAGGKIEIQFYLTSAQIRDSTLRISTTLSFEGARPAISMPDFPTWKPSAPAAPVKIDSRGVTRGGYRGYGDEYTFGIAKGRLVAGAVNKIVIEAASGSSGAGFLSPNFIVDAIQFEGPAPAATTTTAAPTTTTTVAPTTTTTTTTTVAPITTTTTTTTVAPTTTTTTTPALITTTASTVTVTDTVTASTTITETLPAISVTLTETLPAVSVTLTETQTLTETETLPAVTVTDTLTLPAETITQIQTETETTTLPAVTTTVTVTPSPIVCGHRYEQCGGVGWTGHKCCAPGTSCQYKNAYYSQCL